MTPLASFISKLKKPEYHHINEATKIITPYAWHYFECTEIYSVAADLSEQNENYFDSIQKMSELIFLPAPKTWIEVNRGEIFKEYRDYKSRRIPDIEAFLLEEDDSKEYIVVHEVYCHGKHVFVNYVGVIKKNASSLADISKSNEYKDRDGVDLYEYRLDVIILILGLINTPKIIGRRQITYSEKQEKLMQKFAGSSFPYNGWTELKLKVTIPPRFDPDVHEAHLTGARALHFCRAHLRLKNGRIEFVRSHWRGDPALGMKNTRYKVIQ